MRLTLVVLAVVPILLSNLSIVAGQSRQAAATRSATPRQGAKQPRVPYQLGTQSYSFSTIAKRAENVAVNRFPYSGLATVPGEKGPLEPA